MAALVITEATRSEELFGIIRRSWCLGESANWGRHREICAQPFTPGPGVGHLSVQKADTPRGDHS